MSSNPRIQKSLGIRVSAISKDFQCQPSTAFIIFCLQSIYGLDDFEVEEAVTDGGNDKGIDAIFSQTTENGNKILYIIQSKFFENTEKQLDEIAKTLMIETVLNYVLGDASIDVLNSKLRPKIELARELRMSGDIDKVKLVFITNGQRPQLSIYNDLERFCNGQQQVDFQIYTEQDIIELLLPVSSRPVGEVSLSVIKDTGTGDRSFLNLPDIDYAHGKVIRVDVYDIAKLVENNANIFNANVRGFLGANVVNKQILATLANDEMIKRFAYLNNGITILCDNYVIKPGGEVINLVNPSIINGCQTASTILEAYKLEKILPNTGIVLVRIIESSDSQLKEAIIRASNTQSVVKNRDLISEEPIQKELEEQFSSMGYFYQRKRGAYSEIPEEKRDKIIDLEKAAQAYMSLFLELPAEAKNKKAEIYDDYYRDIFHSQISATALLISYKILELFKNKIKKQKNSYSADHLSLFGNALLHFLPLFNKWVLIPDGIILEDLVTLPHDDSIKILENQFNKHSLSVMNRLVGIMVKIKKDSDFKNYQYFFKSSGSMQKILMSQEGTLDYSIELTQKNYKKNNDLRYTKPDKYSLDGVDFIDGETWQDLFITLMNIYSEKYALIEGDIDFIDNGSRKLVVSYVDEDEKKLRKKLKNGLWLLTNFDSKRLCKFCFSIAEQLNIQLIIKLRQTKSRIEGNY